MIARQFIFTFKGIKFITSYSSTSVMYLVYWPVCIVCVWVNRKRPECRLKKKKKVSNEGVTMYNMAMIKLTNIKSCKIIPEKNRGKRIN